jgi:hypothetical protein
MSYEYYAHSGDIHLIERGLNPAFCPAYPDDFRDLMGKISACKDIYFTELTSQDA